MVLGVLLFGRSESDLMLLLLEDKSSWAKNSHRR